MSDVNPCLSEDIWFEILKNLPVKILGKCRCVCKSWHSLIVSASFMAAHHRHYTRNNRNTLILYKESDERYILFRDLAQLKKGNKLHISNFPFVVPVHNLTFCFKFVGSLCGLLCVSDSRDLSPEDRILLWNPLIQKSIKLSKSTFTGEKSIVGFGYDYRRNDHRVIKISYWEMNMPLVEVYSVQERTWKTICPNYLVDNLINNVSSLHCFCNGIIHWLTTQEPGINSSLGKWLLLFDVAEETFAKTELPQEIVEIHSFRGEFGIFEYQGKLSVSLCDYMVWDEGDISADCRIWVKQDYNVGSSWCKILNVELLYDFYHEGPVQYLGENEELLGFGKESTFELVSYDPKTNEIKELGLKLGGYNKFSAYSESLALLDQEIDDLTADELKRTMNSSMAAVFGRIFMKD